MENIKHLYGNSENELWQQVSADISDDTLDYKAILQQGDTEVLFVIDIDPGGGFESGYQLTLFSSKLNNDDFKFALHHQDYISEIGKFFGAADVEIGYPEFDKKVIIKTNDTERVKRIFADEDTRKVIAELTDFSLHINHPTNNGEKQAFLELEIGKSITDIDELRTIYSVFYKIVQNISPTEPAYHK
ncbi:hypothetical protein [Ferruginibacter albus]|uniref:hypothetical protein n=1 Tax=Ferruginibacter albus TaxID=2875540 RepID=UPI001CC7B4CD|nr:hypothetical protein [Ferruginibacter albus]UAY53271.1 hypothetical protein K9M53_06260 [Ferruginibacter albus]